jgi:hypothetical protein
VKAVILILEVFHATYVDSIRKGTLGISHSNSTVIIVGLIEGFFEAEVLTTEPAAPSIAVQQRCRPLYSAKSVVKKSLCTKLLIFKNRTSI